MQIKEFHPKNGKGKWLAVHIPDHLPYPRKNVKIIASKKTANDLQRVVGPNKDTLAMEIQSILGVDENTLHRKILEGENDDETSKGDDDVDDDDDSEDDDDEDNDNDDDENDVMGDPLNDDETCDDSNSMEDKTDNKINVRAKHRHAKMCKKVAKSKARKQANDGSGKGDDMKEGENEDDPMVHVEQPEGFELRWEDILNNFKNFNVKRRKKICKLFALQNDVCHRVKKRRNHGFKKKLKHYLLKMLRKFLKKNKNDFEDYLSSRLVSNE